MLLLMVVVGLNSRFWNKNMENSMKRGNINNNKKLWKKVKRGWAIIFVMFIVNNLTLFGFCYCCSRLLWEGVKESKSFSDDFTQFPNSIFPATFMHSNYFSVTILLRKICFIHTHTRIQTRYYACICIRNSYLCN